MSVLRIDGHVTDFRGAVQIDAFAEAMRDEMDANALKGDWRTSDLDPIAGRVDVDYLGDMLYHAFKLARACAMDHGPESIREYVADVGNCAWFVADAHDALHRPDAPAPRGNEEKEYTGTGPNQEFYGLLKTQAHVLAARLLERDLPTTWTGGSL